MKEKLKQENDSLKKLKLNLKDIQEKQKNEKEVSIVFLKREGGDAIWKGI